MHKKWHEIDGWFDINDYKVYRYLMSQFPTEDGRFLEIGSYKGRSLVAMHELSEKCGKSITIDVIDTFLGDQHIGEADTYDEFRANTNHIDCIGTVMMSDSRMAYKLFDPEIRYDAIFIDALHTTEAVTADIKNYLPFVKPGGFIAGHDYLNFGVAAAVRSCFGIHGYKSYNNCWYKRKETT